MDTIRLILADDHTMFVDGLEAMLGKDDRFEVVGTASNMRETVSRMRDAQCDVLLTDLNMPGKNGVQMIAELREQFPFTKIVVLTMYYDSRLMKELEECQIHGFLLKNSTKEELIEAVETVYEGRSYRQKSLSSMNGNQDFVISMDDEIKDAFHRQYSLGKREFEVLLLVAMGKSSSEIAGQLGISVDTVNTHRKNIKYKVGLKNTAEIAAFAVRNQLI